MKFYLCFILIFVASCSGKNDSSTMSDKLKMSTAQAFLSNLKDSLIYQYTSVESSNEKQKVMDKYFQKLKIFLWHTPMDSIRITIDKITAKGFTVTAKSHFSSIEFNSKITFKDSMSARLDSIYKYVKSLQPGNIVLVNLGFMGDFQINNPDSPSLSTFRINAFPLPIQYNEK